MKAFKIELFDEVGIIAAPTRSKARYLTYLQARELNARDATTGKPWPALTDLVVHRAPGFDLWASKQARPRGVGKLFAELEQGQLLRAIHAQP